MYSIKIDWRVFVVFLVIVAANTYVGFTAVQAAEYRSSEQVLEEFMNGPMRLLLPVIVALLAGLKPAAELSHRHIAFTRTRVEIRQYIAARIVFSTASVFILFFFVGVLNWICAYVVVPAVDPHAINPASYRLYSSSAIIADAITRAPLSVLLHNSTVAFGLGASAWLGLNAAVFAALAVLAVYLLRRPVIALLVPFAVYVFESVVLQELGIPGASFLISAVFPTGLQNYPLGQAVFAIVALAIATLAGIAVLLVTARKNSRFS